MNQKKTMKKMHKLLLRIRDIEEEMKTLSDKELAGKTDAFKARLADGETTDDLLTEAFAVVCEADFRILGKRPYDAQILGAIALHQGYLAEMNTGEGKTLVATLPLYLNALTGKSTILVTANEYLAIRDAEEMGPVYSFLGLTVCAGVKKKKDERFDDDEKKQIYQSDIVYTTHGVLGFDYLLNNLVTSAQNRFMRELYYVIIDEADSVLLDGAQTPLVISGSPRVQSNLYNLADFFVTTLIEGRDYETEEKKVWLTDAGVRYAEQFFRIPNFYGEHYFEINRHVTLALRAHVLFEKGKEYMISAKGEMNLLDGGSGRMMEGVKLRGGQHQAIEVKEGLEASQETRSVASITFQNLFRMFPKMAGMSGTMADASQELLDVYQKEVLVIPPNRPVQRKDCRDLYFRDKESQLEAAVQKALHCHDKGQPVLLVVSTIADTEMVSKRLLEDEIPHNVLNANNAFWEAEIIREAGQPGAVTVATSMAGRGTDIKLGEGVKELGGLAVIGIGRMGSVRQERQARGRAGRQGDPGFSQFFVSVQDEIVVNSGLANIDKYTSGQKRPSRRKVRKLVQSAQSLGQEYATMGRRHSTDYDKVLQYQRNLIYETRNRLLDGGTVERLRFLEIAEENIDRFLNTEPMLQDRILGRYILDNISYRLDDEAPEISLHDKDAVKRYLLKCVERGLLEQEKCIGADRMDEFVRVAALTAIDEAWVEQVDYLQQLLQAVSGRSTAQRNPIFEYQAEALESFRKMERTILRNVMRNVLLSEVEIDSTGKLGILFP